MYERSVVFFVLRQSQTTPPGVFVSTGPPYNSVLTIIKSEWTGAKKPFPTNMLYIRLRTLATSSSPLNGFVIYKSAPCLNPHDLSNGVFLLVSKIIGMCRLTSEFLSFRHN